MGQQEQWFRGSFVFVKRPGMEFVSRLSNIASPNTLHYTAVRFPKPRLRRSGSETLAEPELRHRVSM